MPVEFPIENVVMLIGAAQGALIAALILQKHRALYANRFLAAMMIALAAILIHLTFEDIGWFAHIRFVFPVLLGIPLAVPPLLYFYAEYLANRTTGFRLIQWLHFLPACLAVALTYALLFGVSGYGDVLREQSNMDRFPPFFLVFNWTIIVQGAVYIILALSAIGRYDRRIREVYSSIEALQLRWLRNITLYLVVAWFVFLAENSLATLGISISHFILSSVLVATYLLVLGYLGLLKSGVLEAAAPSIAGDGMDRNGTMRTDQSSDEARYEKSGLTPDAARRYKDLLVTLMEQNRMFVRSDLTLLDLATELKISPHNLSEVINTQLDKNFYEFVNSYRVEQVRKDLADPAKQHLKLLSIGYDAGFNSKASFNTVFKQFTSLTPSEYRKRVRGSSLA